MNMNLAYNSVGLYQISKLLCIPTILVIETIINQRKQELTMTMILSLCMIMLGVALFAVKDSNIMHSRILGYIWAALAILATSLSQVYFGPLQKALDFNPMQLLYHTSPLLTLGSFVIIPLFENRMDLMNTVLTIELVKNLVFTCIGAVLLNLTNYFVLSHTSPLTYLILGHVKTIIILVLGFLLFEHAFPSVSMSIGIGLSLFGVVLYSWENHRQQILKTSSISSFPVSLPSLQINSPPNKKSITDNV